MRNEELLSSEIRRFAPDKPLSESLEVGDALFSRSGTTRRVAEIPNGDSGDFSFDRFGADGKKSIEKVSHDKSSALDGAIGYVLTKEDKAIILSEATADNATKEEKEDYAKTIEGVKAFQKMMEAKEKLATWVNVTTYEYPNEKAGKRGRELSYSETADGLRDKKIIQKALKLHGEDPIFREYELREKAKEEAAKKEKQEKEQRDREYELARKARLEAELIETMRRDAELLEAARLSQEIKSRSEPGPRDRLDFSNPETKAIIERQKKQMQENQESKSQSKKGFWQRLTGK